MILKIDDTKKVEHLFSNWKETMLWSCLQHVMGDIYADSLEKPVSAMAILGDFCFLGGAPKEELIRFKPTEHRSDFIIMASQNDEWGELITSTYGENAKKVIRYAIKKEGDVFDRQKLQEIVDSLPPEYNLRLIDEELYRVCGSYDWSKDWVAQFSNYEIYQRLGLGVAILKDGELVSGASSYTRYQDGIEIQIDTREDYRRKGLALVCGAKLILECLKRGLYPSWDAQNKGSVALAEKLGYHFDHEYPAYEISGY